jgi:hypothetical protein
MSKGSTSIGISALTLIYTSEQSYIGRFPVALNGMSCLPVVTWNITYISQFPVSTIMVGTLQNIPVMYLYMVLP